MRRPRTCFLGLLVALLLAAQAPAQSDEPPPRPRLGAGTGKNKDRGPIRMGGNDENGEDEGADPPPPPSLPERSEPELLVDALSQWPRQEARQAAVMLAAQPTVAYPLLEKRMLSPGLDWRTVAGVAAALGQVGNMKGLELIEAKLHDRKMYLHSGDLFDGILRLDPVGGKARLRAALLHPASAVVREAEKRLASRVSQADRDGLRDVFEAGGQAARTAAVRLLARADPEGARVDLVRALRDKSPLVCAAAAEAIGRDVGKEALDLLRKATTASVDRQVAYATLALAYRAERTRELVVDRPMARTLLGGRGVRNLERLNRACAAILLADVGYFHDLESVDGALDRVITPALLEAWVAADFWKDTKVIRPLVLRRLQRLTGNYDMERAEDWVSWWERNRDGFRARRVLIRVEPELISGMRVDVSGAGAPGDETTILAGQLAHLTASIRGEFPILLLPEDMNRLAQMVNASGILDVTEGFTGSLGGGGPLSVTVRAGDRQRRTFHRPELLGVGSEELLAYVETLRERYRWQRYRPSGAGVAFGAFVETMAPAFAEDRPKEERDAALAGLIVQSVAGAGVETAVRSLKDLASLPDLPALLGDEEIDHLLRILGEQDHFGLVAEGLLDVLTLAKKPEAHPLLLDFLATRPSPRSHELTVSVLRGSTAIQVGDALRSERSGLRVAALDALAPDVLKGAEIAAAREALGDAHPTVREAAVRALGRLRAEDMRGHLEELAASPGELQTAAVTALGRLGGKASLAIIMQAYANDDPGLRVAAIEAFAAAGEPQGLSAIVFAMSGDPSSMVREVAGRAILRIGTDRAAAALRQLAVDPGQPPGPRTTAVKSLSALRGVRASEDLERLLRDESEPVADAAALALAHWREAAAVPRLLAMLEAHRNTVQVRQALECLSLESFEQRDPAMLSALYAGWWDLSESRGPRGWLRDALFNRGVEDPALDIWAEGRNVRAVVPTLLQTLSFEEWYLRRAADLALREILVREVGEQEPWTPPGEAAGMRRKWERIWAEKLAR